MPENHPWLSSYEPQVRSRLDYPEKLLTDCLIETAHKYPEQDAIEFFGAKLRYRQLLDYTYRFANALLGMGVRKGDRVSLILPNIPQYVYCYYGVLSAGAIVVQTNPLYTERELAVHLRDAGVKTVVCLDLVYPKIKKLRGDLPLERIIVTGIQDHLPFPKKQLFPLIQKRKGTAVKIDKRDDLIILNELLKHASPQPVSVSSSADSEAVLQYTGGTTGTPKGVVLTHRNLAANVIQCREWIYKAREGEERIMTVVPMFHVYGMTVCMNFGISIAATLILMPKFEIDALLKTIDNRKPTLFPGAPTLYIAVLNHPRLAQFDLTSITCCISGSAPLPFEVKQQFEAATGGKLVEGYGLSECSPVTHCNPCWGEGKTGSIGLPWPDTDCKIMNDEAEEAAVGEVGELLIRGPQVMKGYWNRPQETAETLKDGWVRTGDLARMDEDGYFYIIDRIKDIIIAGGLKVFPREVEEVLYEFPAVREAAVIGAPDEYRGETVKAFIVLKEESQASEDELDAFCRERLASYKVPRIYEFRDELPKSMIGKVLRRKLAEEEKNNAHTI